MANNEQQNNFQYVDLSGSINVRPQGTENVGNVQQNHIDPIVSANRMARDENSVPEIRR